jgi:LysR family glycine cleavage system transcriptional activator
VSTLLNHSAAPAAETIVVPSPTIRRPVRLPPLNLIRAFDAAARHGNFRIAAEEIGVTPSAVSQQIRQMEEFLDVKLFRRLPRRVELTREGTALADAVQEALGMITRACEKLVDPARPQVICLSAIPALASRWLIPRLKRFMDVHAGIKITLLASNDPVDFDRQDIDVAIRAGSHPDPGVRSELLAPNVIVPVCSADLLRGGRITTPADLAHQTLLQVVNGVSWSHWLEAAGFSHTGFRDTLYFNDPGLMLEAAALGQGICLTSSLLAEADLLSGRLVRPFQAEVQSREGYYLLSSMTLGEKPALAMFRAWLRAEAEHTVAAQSKG